MAIEDYSGTGAVVQAQDKTLREIFKGAGFDPKTWPNRFSTQFVDMFLAPSSLTDNGDYQGLVVSIPYAYKAE